MLRVFYECHEVDAGYTCTQESFPRSDSSSCGSFRDERFLRSFNLTFRHDQVKLQVAMIVQAADDRVLSFVDADSKLCLFFIGAPMTRELDVTMVYYLHRAVQGDTFVSRQVCRTVIW